MFVPIDVSSFTEFILLRLFICSPATILIGVDMGPLESQPCILITLLSTSDCSNQSKLTSKPLRFVPFLKFAIIDPYTGVSVKGVYMC
jgi:hypothetical protein